MHLIKLVVLGAPGVGKTSIIQQFVENYFNDSYNSTTLNPFENSYNFAIIMNESVYQVKIVDMPVISYFPSNAFYEWSDYRGCALRSAHGYLLIFDLTSSVTLQYVKVIRDQLTESRNMQNIPVYVVGNKADLCTSVLNNMRGSHHHGHHHHHHSSQFHHHSSHHIDHDITPAFKELASLVKKQWKCNYLECSAKYNWRIVPIFKDILKTIEANQRTLEMSSAHRDHEHHDSLKFSLTTASGHFLTTTHSTRSSVPMRTSNTINSSSCVII